MAQDQITALAREYAEQTSVYEYLQDNPKSTSAKIILDITVRDAADVIRFLLRRFCLVENSKVSEMYDAAMEVSRLPKSIEARGYAISRLQTLESLFPEIGKEVEE